jgi:DNA mismatch endonuclease Vsr
MRVVHPSAETSARMRRIRQKDTKIEAAVALGLRDLGLHYRKNVRNLPGSPDFANKSKRWAVFVHGCFWHHHTGCHKATVPKSNRRFWLNKFRDNMRRDARCVRLLRREGYRVVVIWECQEHRIQNKLTKILEARCIDS